MFELIARDVIKIVAMFELIARDVIKIVAVC